MNNIIFFKLYLTRLVRRYYQKMMGKSGSSFSFFSLNNKFFSGFLIILILSGVLIYWVNNQKTLSCPVVSEGIVGAYNNTNLPVSVTSLLSDSLYTLDKNGSPSARLVDHVSSNQENTNFTLTLKKNLVWNDGSKVKSSDIKITLPDIEVSYPDDSTINFKLADSFSPFLTLLTQPILKPDSLTGLGRYKVISKEVNRGHISKLVLEPVDKITCNENPLVSIRFYQDEQTIKTAFSLGEIDAILAITDISDLMKQPNVLIKKIQSYNKLTAIFYNTKDPILDKNYRKALNFATQPVENEDKAKTSIPPVSWAFNMDLKEAHGDTASAKTYFAKVETGKDKPVTLITSPYLANLAQKIVEDWKKIGVNAVIRTESGNPQNFQALLATVSIPHDPDQYTLWHSTQTNTNISKYSSPRVDKDLEDGRKIGDFEKRREKYFDFQKVLQDDAPATFLYFPKVNVVYRAKVGSDLEKILSSQIFQY